MSWKKQYNSLSSGQRALLLGAGLYAAYRIGKFFFPGDVKSGGQAQDINYNPANLTYTPQDYEIFADELEAAFWGSAWYELDDTAGQVLQLMATDDDVYKLIGVYGIRGRGIVIKEEYNLPQTIAMYLDDDVKASVNNLYSTRGMTVQW